MGNKILKNTLYYTIGEIVPRFLSFILLPIFTLYLTTEEYGINSYLTSVMSFVLVFSALSLNTFLLRNYFLTKTEKEKKEMIGSIFLFIIFFNVLLVIIQMSVYPLLIAKFEINIPFYPYFYLIILIYFLESVSIVPLLIYRVRGQALKFLVLNLSRTILQVIVVYIYVVIYERGLEGSLIARLLINIPFFFVYIIIISKNGVFRIKAEILKKGLKFSLPLVPGALSFLLISLSDRIILERYISLSELGVFSVAATLCLLLNVITQSLTKSFEPIIFKEFTNINFPQTNMKLFKIYLVALFSGAFCVSIFSKEFFVIATSKAFINGYKIVPFLIIPIIISGINTFYGIHIIASKKTKLNSLTFTINAGINVLLNFILIPSLGYYGAIIASAFAFLLTNLIFLRNIVLEKRFLIAQSILISLITVTPFFVNNYLNISFVYAIIAKTILLIVFFMFSMRMLEVNYKKMGLTIFNNLKFLK